MFRASSVVALFRSDVDSFDSHQAIWFCYPRSTYYIDAMALSLVIQFFTNTELLRDTQ